MRPTQWLKSKNRIIVIRRTKDFKNIASKNKKSKLIRLDLSRLNLFVFYLY